MVIIISFAILVILILAVRDPFIGLLGLLMVNILRPGEMYPQLAALHVERITAVFVLISFLVHERRFALPKITKTVLWFWITMFLSIPLAYWPSNALSSTVEFGQTIVYHLLIVALTNTEQRLRAFLVTFTVLIGWLAGSSLYLYLSGGFIVRMGIERAVGLTSAGGDPNTLSNTLVSGLPLIGLLFFGNSTKKIRLLALCVMIIAVVTVISTGSRTGFFTLIFLIGSFVATRRHSVIYILIAVVFLGIGWTLVPEQYKQRYQTVEKLDKDDSYQNRLRAWHAGWNMFKHNPLTGMGTDNFTYAAGGEYWPGEGRKIWLNAHSLPLKALGDLGLLGTTAFIYILVTLFKLNMRLKKKLAHSGFSATVRYFPAACNFALLVLLLAGYSSHNLYRNTWFMLASLSGGVQLMVEAREKKLLEAPPAADEQGAVGTLPSS